MDSDYNACLPTNPSTLFERPDEQKRLESKLRSFAQIMKKSELNLILSPTEGRLPK